VASKVKRSVEVYDAETASGNARTASRAFRTADPRDTVFHHDSPRGARLFAKAASNTARLANSLGGRSFVGIAAEDGRRREGRNGDQSFGTSVLAFAAGDAKALTAAPGIGPKQAQRIVLELKDKISGIQPVMSAEMPGVVLPTVTAGASTEASKALVALGYSQTEAAQLVSRLDQSMTVEQMIAAALRAAAQM